MTTTDIRVLDPDRASEQDLAGYHTTYAAALCVDMPENPPLTYESAVGSLRNPPHSDGACTFWAAFLDDRVAGFLKLGLPNGENDKMAFVETTVHPELRRRGFGTDLLRAAMPTIEDAGREIVLGSTFKPDSAGDEWTRSLGFEITLRTVIQRLDVAGVPPGTWDVPVPDGYRLERWIGAAPEELLDSYAAARPAYKDAPTGRGSTRATLWTPARIRQVERELTERAIEERVVVAVDQATNAIVGVTSLLNYPHRPEVGNQNDTSVVAAHRGRGLGRVMKAAMMRWLTAERPALERVWTVTAEENTYMIDVNQAVGYHTARTMLRAEIPTHNLADHLNTTDPNGRPA